jgi:hypothetical protein
MDPRACAAPMGRAQNNLGNALLSLGERENDTARLEEAVAACRAAPLGIGARHQAASSSGRVGMTIMASSPAGELLLPCAGGFQG